MCQTTSLALGFTNVSQESCTVQLFSVLQCSICVEMHAVKCTIWVRRRSVTEQGRLVHWCTGAQPLEPHDGGVFTFALLSARCPLCVCWALALTRLKLSDRTVCLFADWLLGFLVRGNGYLPKVCCQMNQ